MASNTAYVMQPHFMSDSFRAALKNQQGDKYNYVVITCSPSYNGVWRYDSSLTHSFPMWMNNKTACVCIPISVCEKYCELDEIKNPVAIEAVKKQQQKWYKNEVKNVEHKYRNKPDWMM